MRKLLVLAALLLLAGSVISVTAEEKAQKAEVGKKFIDFTAKTLKQDKFVFSEAIEGKVAILKFGAVWCGWCKKMWDELKKVHDEMGDKVVIVEVDTLDEKRNETEAVVRKYNDEKGTPWEVVIDDKGINGIYVPSGVGIPHSLIIGPDGIIKKRIGGYKTFDKIKPLLDLVIAGKEIPPDPGEVGYVVPDFTIKDMDDNDFVLYDALKGGPVVMKFSATWFTDGNALDDYLVKLQEKYGEKATIANVFEIGSATRDKKQVETKETVVEYLKDKELKHKVLLDEKFKAIQTVGKSIFCFAVLDKYGRIAGIFDVKTDYETIEKCLINAFDAKKPEDTAKDEPADK